eukprot:11189218-Lingulodinium_polyedra.AAC.1
MWAIRADIAAAPTVAQATTTLTQLQQPGPVLFTTLLAAEAGDMQPRQGLNEREPDAMEAPLRSRSFQRLSQAELEDLV